MLKNANIVVLLCALSLLYIARAESEPESEQNNLSPVTVTIPGKKEPITSEVFMDKYHTFGIAYGKVSHVFQPAVECDVLEPSETYSDFTQLYNDTKADEDVNGKMYLHLAVETNDVKLKKPVFVYVPGYDLVNTNLVPHVGGHLPDNDVVVVTVEYRPHALGFISTNTKEIPGNMGAHDIILALKWIQNHISHFGGDPTRVTVSGHFKAAGLLGYLAVSPLTENLFHRLILNSPYFMEHLTTTKPLDVARQFSTHLGCDNADDVAALNKCILESTVSSLLEAYDKFLIDEDGDVAALVLGGISDVWPGEKSLEERIHEIKGKRKYEFIFGFVQHPSVFLEDRYNKDEYSQFSMKAFKEDFGEDLVKKTADEQKELNELKEFAEIFLDSKSISAYVSNYDNLIYKANAKILWPISIDIGDFHLKKAMILSMIEFEELGKTYLYSFNYKNTHWFSEKVGNWLINYVTMLDDHRYLVNSVLYNDEDKRVSELMIELWTSFIKHGEPDSSKIYEWPAISETSAPYLVIDALAVIGMDYSNEYLSFTKCARTPNCAWNIDED